MVFNIISVSSLLIPLIAGLYFHYRIGELQTYFLWFVGFSCVFEIASSLLAYNGINNHWVFRLFLVCDFLFFAWFFYQRHKYPKWLLLFTYFIMGFIVFDYFNTLLFHVSLYNTNLFFLSVFLYFIVLSYYVLITLLDEYSPTLNPIFWIASARLFYYTCIFVIYVSFTFPAFSSNSSPSVDTFAIINGVGNIVCNILFGVSFLCKRVQV